MKRVLFFISMLAAFLPSISESASPVSVIAGQEFEFATPGVWQYVRRGLTFLESPAPESPPESIAPSYIHPDGKGFGAYGFSPAAYADVQRCYPFFRSFSWEEVLDSPELYEQASRAFCDWLLERMQEYLSEQPEAQEVFEVVHQAWNLGLRGFREGRKVVASRRKRALRFICEQP